MIIVLEGPDGSGKSTLAEAIYRKTSATALRQGPPPRGRAMQTFASMVRFAAGHPAPVVIDRLHWGAWPYGIVYRGGSELEMPDIIDLNLSLVRAGAVIVYVRADADVLDARIVARGEERSEFEVASEMPRIVDLYDDVYEASLPQDFNFGSVLLHDANEFGDTDYDADMLIKYADRQFEQIGRVRG